MRLNSWDSLFNIEPIAAPTTVEECEVWFEKLESELSPENLHCDGEISRADAAEKLRHLQAVWADLEQIRGSARAVH